MDVAQKQTTPASSPTPKTTDINSLPNDNITRENDKNKTASMAPASTSSATPAGPPTVVTNVSNKSLPNIQPKVAIPSNGIPRQIIPRGDGKQPGAVAAAASPAQPGSILVPQGIQHVLINGQLYPIIQTANGTHLLIQQPVGQIQQNGGAPQVFTAQPIQLTNTSTAGNTSISAQNITIPSQSTIGSSATPTQTVSVSSATVPISSSTTQLATSATNSSMTSASSTSISQTTSSMVTVSNTPVSFSTSVNLQNGSKSQPTTPPTTSVTVSPQTQQVLSKIHAQIEALKPKAETDATAKQNLNQLQHIQQQIFNQIRQQMHTVQQRANSGQPITSQSDSNHVTSLARPAGNVSTPPSSVNSTLSTRTPAPGLQNSTNLPPVGVIVQPATGGKSAMTSANVTSLVSAFMNVRVGAQLYNIQLSEEQKTFMIEKMSKMNPDQQRAFVQQQQVQILSSAFRAQPPAPIPTKPAGLPNTERAVSTPSPKPQTRSRSRRRPAPKLKPDTPPSYSPLPESDTISQSSNSTPTSKSKPAAPKRPRYTNFSCKKIGERMLTQIQKDQEVLLKPGGHKKAFHSSSQLSERLLRYHIYYMDDRLQMARRLQEADLFDTIAHKLVLKKEELTDRFRSHLWRDSFNENTSVEDQLIADLLLEDEKQAADEDKILEFEDIDLFKSLYTQPEKKVPTPPPTPPPISLKPATTSRSPTPKRKPKEKSQPKPVTKQVTSRKPPLLRPFHMATSTRRRTRLRLQVSVPKCDRDEADIHTDMSGGDITPAESIEKSAEDAELPPQTTEAELKLDDVSVDSIAEKLADRPVAPLRDSTESRKQSEDSTHDSLDESVDEEDDIIDIGDPPTPPPVEIFPSVPSTPTTTAANPFLTPSKPCLSREESFTSSPNKYFSICSETVVEQSEQVDHSGEQNHSLESSTSTHISAEEDLISEPGDESPNHDLNHVGSQKTDLELSHHQFAADEGGVETLSNDQDFGGEDTESETEDQQPLEEERISEEEELANSGEVTEYEESDGGEVDYATDDASNDNDKRVIAPLRISKRQLQNYDWSDPKRQRVASPPAIKLRISEPVPPPIRLRIKRDQNDTWEAASSIGSYAADNSEPECASDGEAEDADESEEEPTNGGVAVNWDDVSAQESVTSDEEQELDFEENQSYALAQRHQHNLLPLDQSDDEDSVPFGNYSYNSVTYPAQGEDEYSDDDSS